MVFDFFPLTSEMVPSEWWVWRVRTAGGTPATPEELLGLGWGSVGGPEVLGHEWLSRCLPVSAWRGSSSARSWEVCPALPGGPRTIGGCGP